MSGTRRATAFLSGVVAFSFCATSVFAAGITRGLVVDRSDDFLWLGFPDRVETNSMFNVMLVPGDDVIAKARVLDCTPDAPFVAKSSFTMKDKSAFIPVGAYVESTGEVVDDRDNPPGLDAVSLSHRDQERLSFQAGTILLPSGQLSRETSSAYPAFGLSYRAGSTGSVDLLLSAGYTRRSGTFTQDGVSGRRSFRGIPVTIDAKFRLSGERKTGWYAKAGAGAWMIRDRRTVGEVTTGADSVRTRFGWHAGLGYESKSGGFAQASYMGVKSTGLKGVALSLGTRF